jgi:subtilisin family serine protease
VAAVVVALRAPALPAEARALPARRAAIARTRDAVLATLAAGDVTVERVYQTVPGFTARVSAAGLEQLAANPDVVRVDLDPLGGVAAGGSMAQIRAEPVHARGVTGIGTTIAVIDSGVDATHPDIADALVHEECFCRAGRIGDHNRRACCPGRIAHASGPGSAASVDPHGPHVAGIAVSRGRVAPVGVAPGAQLVAVRVLDDDNLGFLSDWVAALDWLAAERPDVRVINMSLVSNDLYRKDCGHDCGDVPGCAANLLLADAIDQLWQNGTVVFAAAGNEGRTNAMTAPACIARAVAVGAVDADDAVARFSNSSPDLDLLAPGVDIVSDGLDGKTATLSGTSMATPHAAGVAALVLSARPGLNAADLEQLLGTSGVAVLDARTGRVTPRVDAFAALHAATQGAEFERGSGSRGADCLLEWNFVPPAIVARRGWPVAVCRDNDPGCDADDLPGRCTFVYAPCYNMRDPLLRQCATDEPLLSFVITSPRVDAPAGTTDRTNVDFLASALPDFPFAGSDTCSAAIPFVVERAGPGAAGFGHIRMAVSTATRRDYDHVVLECLPPR